MDCGTHRACEREGAINSSLASIGSTGSRSITPGYQRAIEGLRTFDRLSQVLAQRQDAVQRNLAAATPYPEPGAGRPAAAVPAAATLTGALAGFLSSQSGHEILSDLGAALTPWVKRLVSPAALEAGPLA